MLQTRTKEQMNNVIHLLTQDGVHCRSVLNFDSEADIGYNYYNDRIHIYGDVTFDRLSEIVDYLRQEYNAKSHKARWAAITSGVDNLWASGDTIYMMEVKKDEAVKFIQSLSEFGYDVDTLMEEYNKTWKITI